MIMTEANNTHLSEIVIGWANGWAMNCVAMLNVVDGMRRSILNSINIHLFSEHQNSPYYDNNVPGMVTSNSEK